MRDFRPASDYRFEHFARVIRDEHTGTTMLQVITPEETVELSAGDEFVTVRTVVEL